MRQVHFAAKWCVITQLQPLASAPMPYIFLSMGSVKAGPIYQAVSAYAADLEHQIESQWCRKQYAVLLLSSLHKLAIELSVNF